MIRRHLFLYHDPLAGDDAGDGTDGAAAGGDQGGAGDQGAAGGDQTILGGDGDEGAPEIPEKFLVKGQDGTPDYKAIFGKMAPSYTELEKRLGSIGMPPKSAEEYKLEKYLPDTHQENTEAMKPILAKFHEAGLTNKQVQSVMNLFGEQLAVATASEKASHEAGITKLKETWGDAFAQNLTHAKAAISVYGTPEERQLLTSPKYGNDPVLLQFLAKIGADLGEDRLPNDLQGGAGVDIEALRRSEAYLNSAHPDHKATVAKVNAAYRGGYKSKAA
jgi:hypothetical protein